MPISKKKLIISMKHQSYWLRNRFRFLNVEHIIILDGPMTIDNIMEHLTKFIEELEKER